MWGIILAAAAVFGTIIVVAVITNKRVSKKKTDADRKDVQGKEYIIKKLHDCKECKIKGDYKGFFQSAFDVAQEISSGDKTFLDTLSGTLEKVQFGGYKPASDEIERVFRHVEKKVGEITSDKKEEEMRKCAGKTGQALSYSK